MSDKKQEKKRRRKNSKKNEPAKKETKEQRDSAKKMAASSGSASTSTSGSNLFTSGSTSGSSDLPSSYPVSSFLNIPSPFPRFPNYSNATPMANVFPATSLGPQVTPTNSQSQSQPPTNDFSSQLNFIMSKVSKLDGMEAQQNTILTRLNSIEAAVSENKRMIESTNRKISEVEISQGFLSDKYDRMTKSMDVNKTEVSKVQDVVKKLTLKNNQLKKDNQTLADDVTDLKCRSMRDNLVIIGIPETVNSSPLFMGAVGGNEPREMDTNQANNETEESSQPRSYAQVASREDCNAKVWEFCEAVLKIPNPRESVLIDRAHRTGAFKPGKPRAMIVKFKDTDSKMLVKSTAKELDLKQTPYGVFDQYPPEVQEKRRALIPIMLKAKDERKKAVLVRDKLYINNKLYEPSVE